MPHSTTVRDSSVRSLGIDGGQSEVRARCGTDGPVFTVPGARRGADDTTTAVLEVVALARTEVPGPLARVVAGLTTLPAVASERIELARRLVDVASANEVWVGDDAVTSHAGAFAGAPGVVLAVGTGAVALAFDPDRGRVRTFDGAGALLGDEGGAFWIGRHAIRAALAADEGRGPATALGAAVVDALGPLDGLAARLHEQPRAVDSIAWIAPIALDVAEGGDAVATRLLDDAADRLATTAAAAVRFLGVAVVGITGRVVENGGPLRSRLDARLRSLVPGVSVLESAGSSLDGACRLASSDHADPYRPLFTIVRCTP